MKAGEVTSEAILRELREEIGLTAHKSIKPVCDFKHRPDFRRGEATLFVIQGVQYRPRWSLEVKAVGEFNLKELPMGTAPITHTLLKLAKAQLP